MDQVEETTRVLYLTYDGLMEPLGQSQVLPYLQRLAHHHMITLVSYEKPGDWADVVARKRMEAEVRKAGIEWVPLRYHRHPTLLATSYDLAVGFIVTMYFALRRRIQLVHVRSYVPAVLALGLKKILKTRFIFDMRAFWADQRVECGVWRRDSWLYWAAKWFERRFLTSADVVVSLTHAGVSAMREFDYLRDNPPRFEVITTCTDLELFRPADASSCPVNESSRPFTLGFVGSLGPWYMFDLMINCFKILRERCPDARLRIVNQQMHAQIRNQLQTAGVPQDCVEIKAEGYHGVAQEIRRMDAGMFFLKPYPSFKAVAPTKLGEFLASGVPCLSNAGIGDLEEILEGNSVGVILRKYDRQGQEDAVGRLLELAANPETRQRCVNTARRYFSLEHAVQAYDSLYRSLTSTTAPEPSKGRAGNGKGQGCPLCGSDRFVKLGIRGTREFFGADPNYEPHLVTDVVRCRVCDFIYAYPVLGIGDLEREHYNNPDKYCSAGEFDPATMHKTRLDLISGFKNKGILLDVGAGKGEFLAEALKEGWEVQGVEPSSNFCAYVRERFHIEVHAGYLGDSLPIPEHGFDVITLNHVLEHMVQPHNLLNLLPRYLKHDGVVFIEVPNCDSYFLRVADLYFRVKGLDWSSRLSPFHPPFHRFGFTARSLKFLMQRCDYRILHMATFSGRDRGFLRKTSRWHPEAMLRDLASRAFRLLGNRELLAVIAKPVES